MPLKIIDFTTFSLNLTYYKWATFRKTKAGAKLHLRLMFMGKDNVYPDKMIMTTSDELSDIYRSRWAIGLFFKWLK